MGIDTVFVQSDGVVPWWPSPFFCKSLKNFFSRAVGTKGSWGEKSPTSHRLWHELEAKLSPLKSLLWLLDPLDFQTFLWPCSLVNKRLFKSQTALSLFSESKPANLMIFTIFYGGCSTIEASFKSLLSIHFFFNKHVFFDKCWRWLAIIGKKFRTIKIAKFLWKCDKNRFYTSMLSCSL